MARAKLKILLVDDELDARAGVARTLRLRGYEVLEAATGGEVLSRAKEEWPALIILDIVLPDIPGTVVFEKLRQDPITKTIPVLLVTAKSDVLGKLADFSESRDRALEKPARLEDLVKTVQEMLTGRR
ncbi:MAG: response regulator [Candidatus Omnitrophica bacterium]|nr:response regulator [Candidatus Omnitrophota bacterium]